MARLTILQASQQGFGSTLTIHRHIKDGTLPVYEDGDTKLLDVDDLIAVFGEPGIAASDTVAPAANGHVDIHEFNRLRTELDQKNKKNMWLAADLAEVVRELKEKEASFEKERNRLLTVLEQAQALLLRESGKDGKLKAAMEQAGTATPPDEIDGTDTDNSPESFLNPPIETAPEATEEPDVSIEFGADIDIGGQTIVPDQQSLDDLLPKLGIPAPGIEAENEAAPMDNADSIDTAMPDAETGLDMPQPAASETKPDVNPMMPPLDDPNAEPRKSRSIGATTWALLIMMIGGGFVFFEYRTKVIAGLTKLGKLISGF
ncbi:MAG: hypothetical protein HOM58_06180 [Rhodospirillaceae bacterium]|jgi:hypothetical protein|nr:hypothetical protein [Rhodospirillaceae bacterium]MBT5455242.1 hypothetical protein [Rhodospirillaceae bacterium]